ncbi:hypothetical protein SAVCW2_75030 [Streptomyces avermitilis]|nr:hypothetical protein SAVCW2_75030 [Streptomyces avermitilis]
MPTRDDTHHGSATATGLWFPAPPAPGDCAVRLLCLPYAGGSPVMYRTWDKALAGTADVLPLCLPGRAHRWGEPLEHDLHRIADDVAEATAPLQKDLPLALFGYSLGALLAFEVARGLARRGRPPLLLIVAACAPPRECGALSPKHTLPDEEFIALLREMGRLPRPSSTTRRCFPCCFRCCDPTSRWPTAIATRPAPSCPRPSSPWRGATTPRPDPR